MTMLRELSDRWGTRLSLTDITHITAAGKGAGGVGEGAGEAEGEGDGEGVCVDGYTASIGLFRSEAARAAVRLNKRARDESAC